MLNHTDYAWVDNYLDLYLYAGRLHDKEWQDEIKAKLTELHADKTGSTREQEKSLKQQYVEVNRKILGLYRLLNGNVVKASAEFNKNLFKLKQKRLDLGRKIDELKSQNQQIFG